jgi:hypothetical protein
VEPGAATNECDDAGRQKWAAPYRSAVAGADARSMRANRTRACFEHHANVQPGPTGEPQLTNRLPTPLPGMDPSEEDVTRSHIEQVSQKYYARSKSNVFNGIDPWTFGRSRAAAARDWHLRSGRRETRGCAKDAIKFEKCAAIFLNSPRPKCFRRRTSLRERHWLLGYPNSGQGRRPRVRQIELI